MWQKLCDNLQYHNFVVIAVAMDSRPDAARPWVEAADPSYPVLIDRDHQLADLYNMVNVPQAVWIDEAGRIVRPTETAGAFEGFRAMDRTTGKMPDDAMTTTVRAKTTYAAAVRDWVERGTASEHAFADHRALAHLRPPTAEIARAHVLFRLGQHLLRLGQDDEAAGHLAEASRLHPDSWNIWRQIAEPNEIGLAAGPDFWARVDALGERRYYAPVDMAGMPE